MAYITIANGLTIVVPTKGTRNYSEQMLENTFKKISSHDHTGSGKGNLIGTNALSPNAVTSAKLATAIQTQLNNALQKDGTVTPTANLPMGGFKHTNVGLAAGRTEYLTLGQVVDAIPTKVSATGGTADVITLTLTIPIPAYVAGQEFTFIATGTNTAAATINIDGLGARNIVRPGIQANVIAGDIISGKLYKIIYTGSVFVLINCVPSVLTWTPTITTASGSLSSTTTNCIYKVGLDNLVEFEMFFDSTLSGGPSALMSFTLPVTAIAGAVSRCTFAARGNVGLVLTNGFSYLFNTTTGYIELNSGASWINGTVQGRVSGSYLAG